MMYMAGGEYPDGSASQAFMRYDPVLDLWQEMANLRTPRSELGKIFSFLLLKSFLVNDLARIVKIPIFKMRYEM